MISRRKATKSGALSTTTSDDKAHGDGAPTGERKQKNSCRKLKKPDGTAPTSDEDRAEFGESAGERAFEPLGALVRFYEPKAK